MPTTTKNFILTREGLSQLKGEYEELVKVKRPAIANRIQRAREFGDLSENSEYDAAKEEQSLLEARIVQLEQVLAKTEIKRQKGYLYYLDNKGCVCMAKMARK